MRLLFALIIFIFSCQKDSYSDIYYFEKEFFTTSGLHCDEIKHMMGVRLLRIKHSDSFDSMCETLNKYDTAIQEYSSGYTIRITNKGKVVCSNLDLLLKLKEEIPAKDFEELIKLKALIVKNSEKSRLLIPYDIRKK